MFCFVVFLCTYYIIRFFVCQEVFYFFYFFLPQNCYDGRALKKYCTSLHFVLYHIRGCLSRGFEKFSCCFYTFQYRYLSWLFFTPLTIIIIADYRKNASTFLKFIHNFLVMAPGHFKAALFFRTVFRKFYRIVFSEVGKM